MSSPDQPLNRISIIVNHKNNRLTLRLDHSSNLLNRQSHASITRHQNSPSLFPRAFTFQLPPRDIYTQRRSSSKSNTTVVDLRNEPDISWEINVAETEIRGSGFADESVARADEGLDGGPEL